MAKTKEKAKQNKKTMEGEVVSDKMDKTAVIKVEKMRKHPKYKKRYKVTKKYKAHDPENKAEEGDRVTIIEDRPRSKKKRWLILYEESDL